MCDCFLYRVLSVRRFDTVLRSEIEVIGENYADAFPNGFVVVSDQYSHFTRRFVIGMDRRRTRPCGWRELSQARSKLNIQERPYTNRTASSEFCSFSLSAVREYTHGLRTS